MRPRILFVVLLLQIASLREWSRYVPGPAAPLAALLAALIAALLFDRVAPRLARGGRSIVIAWTVAVIAVAAIGYGYTNSTNGLAGSDRDEAIIIAAERMMRGEHPYAEPTYLGNPLSPGPGWVALHIPFVAAGVYWLAPALALAVLPLAPRTATRQNLPMARTIVLSAAAPVMWHELVTGSDLLTIGVVGAAAVVVSAPDTPSHLRMLSAAALAAFMTSRAPFLLGGAAFYATSRAVRSAPSIVGAALAVAAATWVALFAIPSSDYAPLHLLTRAHVIFPAPALAATLLATVIVLGLVSRSSTVTTAERLWNFGAVLLVPLGATAAASLARADWDVASWVGASYLVPAAVPLLLAATLDADSP